MENQRRMVSVSVTMEAPEDLVAELQGMLVASSVHMFGAQVKVTKVVVHHGSPVSVANPVFLSPRDDYGGTFMGTSGETDMGPSFR